MPIVRVAIRGSPVELLVADQSTVPDPIPGPEFVIVSQTGAPSAVHAHAGVSVATENEPVLAAEEIVRDGGVTLATHSVLGPHGPGVAHAAPAMKLSIASCVIG